MPGLDVLRDPRAVLFACLFTSQAALLVLSPTLVDVARDLHVSTATAGQLRSISGAVGGVTALALAAAPRRPGLRTLLSAGAGFVSAGAGLSAAAPSFALLAAAQAVIGVGVGLLVAVGIAAAGSWASPAARPHVLAWAIAGMPGAWIAGMPVAGLVGGSDWRAAWLAVPGVAGLITLALLRLRPRDEPTRRGTDAVGAWRHPDVARFAGGELLANAAWAAVLTYSGALLLESYAISPAVAAAGLALMATMMVPGTFSGRRHAVHATPATLAGLTAIQAGAVALLCTVRLSAVVTFALLAAMAFVNGRRSMAASALGMDRAPEDPVAAMSMRAAANQFGYLLGAAAGGLALALGGFSALGLTLAGLFGAAVLIHVWAPLQAAPSPEPT